MSIALSRAFKKAEALLCAALIMVFVQAAAASVVATVQHAVSGPDHRHMLFTDISFDDDHHPAGQHHEDHVSDHHAMPTGHGLNDGHHHHHGDVGASLLVLGSNGTAWLHDLGDKQRPDPGRLIAKVSHFLPERPPRFSLLSA